ncbi:MAG: RimK family alpha-L-glutamate ligase [Saprospiraceae bacterium]
MKKLKMLVLTDHTNHSSENSLYPLVQAMRKDPRCICIDVATRGNKENDFFFNSKTSNAISVTSVDESFSFTESGSAFKSCSLVSTKDYDVIWLRMPPPLSLEFSIFLSQEFEDKLVINNPAGIHETGSKQFLVNFPEICPPMRICYTVKDIIEFKSQFPIVLKPLREYGGKGIVKIDGEQVWNGKEEMTFTDFSKKLKNGRTVYLGVKFLKNVKEGDKRIVVINGEIMGASLRLPPADSWICNVAMGGRSSDTNVSPEEVAIVKRINPTLVKMGILMYGVDTLVSDDGKRVLSEINTTSIGGLPQIARIKGEPLLEKATKLFWNYITEKTNINVIN